MCLYYFVLISDLLVQDGKVIVWDAFTTNKVTSLFFFTVKQRLSKTEILKNIFLFYTFISHPAHT